MFWERTSSSDLLLSSFVADERSRNKHRQHSSTLFCWANDLVCFAFGSFNLPFKVPHFLCPFFSRTGDFWYSHQIPGYLRAEGLIKEANCALSEFFHVFQSDKISPEREVSFRDHLSCCVCVCACAHESGIQLDAGQTTNCVDQAAYFESFADFSDSLESRTSTNW